MFKLTSTKFKSLVAAIGMGAALASGSASAVLVNSTSSDFVINWSLDIGGGNTISAVGTFDVTSYSTSQIIISVLLQNTTSPSIQEAVLSLGFTTAPAVTGVAVQNSGIAPDWAGTLTGNFPAFQSINLCVYAGNNCAGGSVNDGLQSGASDTFQLTLTGSWANGLSFNDPSAIKFQGEFGSFEFPGTTATTASTDTTATTATTPEPATTALIGLALLALALSQRRRRSR